MPDNKQYLDLEGLEIVWAHVSDGLNNKQDKLTAGDNITIEQDSEGNNIISATGGSGIPEIFNARYGYTTFAELLAASQDGKYITLEAGGKYTFIGFKTNDIGETVKAEFVRLNEKQEIKITAQLNENDSTTWTQSIINLADSTDLQSKQNVLTAGENITIENNVISASGGGSEPSAYLKSASVSDNTLTLTDKNDNTVEFTPSGSLVSGTDDGINWTSITIDGESHLIPSGGGGGSSPQRVFLFPVDYNADVEATKAAIDEIVAYQGTDLPYKVIYDNGNDGLTTVHDVYWDEGNNTYTFGEHDADGNVRFYELGPDDEEFKETWSEQALKIDTSINETVTAVNVDPNVPDPEVDTIYKLSADVLVDPETGEIQKDIRWMQDVNFDAIMPGEDGEYNLHLSIVDGVLTYSWVAEE